jgi:hypothetical protein
MLNCLILRFFSFAIKTYSQNKRQIWVFTASKFDVMSSKDSWDDLSTQKKQTWGLEYQVHRKRQQDNEKSSSSMSYRILVMRSEENIQLETPRC